MEDRLLEVKKELWSYNQYKDKIKWKQERIAELKEVLYSLPVFAGGERVSNSYKPNDRIEYLIDRIDTMRGELLDYSVEIERIEQKLNKLNYDTEKVLRLKYIDRKTLKSIAAERGYSYGGVRYVHTNGLIKYENL